MGTLIRFPSEKVRPSQPIERFVFLKLVLDLFSDSIVSSHIKTEVYPNKDGDEVTSNTEFVEFETFIIESYAKRLFFVTTKNVDFNSRSMIIEMKDLLHFIESKGILNRVMRS